MIRSRAYVTVTNLKTVMSSEDAPFHKQKASLFTLKKSKLRNLYMARIVISAENEDLGNQINPFTVMENKSNSYLSKDEALKFSSYKYKNEHKRISETRYNTHPKLHFELL